MGPLNIRRRRLLDAPAVLIPVLLLVSSCSLVVKGTGPPSGAVPAARCEPGRCVGDAVRLIKEGRRAEAAALLRGVRERSAGEPDAARAAFVLGRLVLEDVRRADGHGPAPAAGADEADGLLIEALNAPHLQSYALMDLARARFIEGRYDESAALYHSLAALYPDSPLLPAAAYERADALAGAVESSSEGGRRAEAVEEIRRYILTSRKGPGVEPYHRAAVYSMLDGDLAAAASFLKEALVNHPADRDWRNAEAALASIAPTAGVEAAHDARDRYRMALNLYNAAEYSRAAKAFRALLDDAASGHRDDSAILLAKSLMRLKRHGEAEKALREYIASKPSDPDKEAEALNLEALVALKQDDEQKLLDALKALERRHGGGKFAVEARLYLGRLYEGRGETARALDSYLAAREAADRTVPELKEDANWRVGWTYYRTGRHGDAAGVFKSLGDAAPANKGARFTYWAARSLEKSGAPGDAEREYSRLCAGDPDGYYCRMARARGFQYPARAAADGPAFGRELDAPRIDADGRFKAASELAMLGLAGEASAELKAAAADYKEDAASLLRMAGLLVSAGDYNGAMAVGYRLPAGSDHYREAARRLAWPEEVIGLITSADPDSYADPRLVASIMREESSFDPRVVSTAGAIGLMQIMPATGENIARELGQAGEFEPAALFKPETSIRYGSWYLSDLGKKFKGDLVLTVAAYNAGPFAVNRWIRERPVDDDEFIESIPYAETRHYVKRVIRSYAEFTAHPSLPSVRVRPMGPRGTADAGAPRS